MHLNKKMALTIILEGETGNEYESIDDKDLISTFLPDYNDKTSYCLRFIDLYGDTTFTNLQMPELINELKRLKPLADTKEKINLIDTILKMAERCKAESHLYLKFYGD
jgi:ABC-type iron transport system FetAB ATPase subunit